MSSRRFDGAIVVAIALASILVMLQETAQYGGVRGSGLATANPLSGTDLLITKPLVSPAAPIAGSPARVQFLVLNRGTSAVTLEYEFDDGGASTVNPAEAPRGAQACSDTLALAGGASCWARYSVVWDTPGAITVRAAVDPSNIINERREENNVRERTITIRSPPAGGAPDTPTVCSTVAIPCTQLGGICNQDSAGFTCDIPPGQCTGVCRATTGKPAAPFHCSAATKNQACTAGATIAAGYHCSSAANANAYCCAVGERWNGTACARPVQGGGTPPPPAPIPLEAQYGCYPALLPGTMLSSQLPYPNGPPPGTSFPVYSVGATDSITLSIPSAAQSAALAADVINTNWDHAKTPAQLTPTQTSFVPLDMRSGLGPGVYSLRYYIRGADGVLTQTVERFSVRDNTKTFSWGGTTSPTTALTVTSNGALVTATMAASDSEGIWGVEFFAYPHVTAANRPTRYYLGTDTQAPYEVTWNAQAFAGVPAVITAQAYDTRGAPSCRLQQITP